MAHKEFGFKPFHTFRILFYLWHSILIHFAIRKSHPRSTQYCYCTNRHRIYRLAPISSLDAPETQTLHMMETLTALDQTNWLRRANIWWCRSRLTTWDDMVRLSLCQTKHEREPNKLLLDWWCTWKFQTLIIIMNVSLHSMHVEGSLRDDLSQNIFL